MFKGSNSIRCIKITDPLIYADRDTKNIVYNRASVNETLDGLCRLEKVREEQLNEELAKPNPNQNRIDKLNEILYDIDRSLRRANQR